MSIVDQILGELGSLIQQGQFKELESDRLEIKPVPSDGVGWKEIHKSINAFLNTRGGILVLGVREENVGGARRYVLSGWNDAVENKLKEFAGLFTDRGPMKLNLAASFPLMEYRDLLGQRVAVVHVDELPADRRYVFYQGTAWRRVLTGDHRILESEVEAQEEFREEAAHAKELQPVHGMTEADLDLTQLNDFIYQLNQPTAVETLKPDMPSARAFLVRRCFVKDGQVTLLGALVCGSHPGDRLGFRAHVHGYVDVPQQVAQDKQDFVDNVLPLMEASLGYVLRNIQVGIRAEGGGTRTPQYPEEVLRETVNNALAHRDYSVNKQVIIAIKPGVHIAIRNPGRFRQTLLVEPGNSEMPVLRILPEAKPRNPKLADVLRVYRKWEGRGIGMATLVSLCLANRLDLPYYRIHSEEVELFLCAGRLLDEPMERLFASLDRYIATRLGGGELNAEQKGVLAYLIKSEWANERVRHTILLTPDNNHFAALGSLERAGLVSKHPAGTSSCPIYIPDRVLVRREYSKELREIFGPAFDTLDETAKGALGVVYRHNHYSRCAQASAKQAAFALWYERKGPAGDIREFDAFYRKVRNTFNKLQRATFVSKVTGTHGYVLRTDFKQANLL